MLNSIKWKQYFDKSDFLFFFFLTVEGVYMFYHKMGALTKGSRASQILKLQPRLHVRSQVCSGRLSVLHDRKFW